MRWRMGHVPRFLLQDVFGRWHHLLRRHSALWRTQRSRCHDQLRARIGEHFNAIGYSPHDVTITFESMNVAGRLIMTSKTLNIADALEQKYAPNMEFLKICSKCGLNFSNCIHICRNKIYCILPAFFSGFFDFNLSMFTVIGIDFLLITRQEENILILIDESIFEINIFRGFWNKNKFKIHYL